METITDTGLGAPAGVLADEEGYLVTDFFGGTLLRVARDGSSVSTVAAGLGNPVEFRRHGRYLYLVDYAGGVEAGRLLRIRLGRNGDAPTIEQVPVVAGHLGNPSAMTIRDSEIIITDDPMGRVMVPHGCLKP